MKLVPLYGNITQGNIQKRKTSHMILKIGKNILQSALIFRIIFKVMAKTLRVALRKRKNVMNENGRRCFHTWSGAKRE